MTDQHQLADLRQAFSQHFPAHNTPVRIFRAPGRTNLIGEHTDYNDGFVFPAAIDRATWIAIAPRRDNVVRVHSEHFNETMEFNVDDTTAAPRHHWSDYVRGVSVKLREAGVALKGAEMLIRSDVPLGAGLSSSASLEVAAALALVRLSDRNMPKLKVALLCQHAENELVGARVGIMDQFVACFGQSGRAIFLDCRTLDHAEVPLPTNVRLVVCNTMVKHNIAAGGYNSRREECEQAVALLERIAPDAFVSPSAIDRATWNAAAPRRRALRDITFGALEKYARLMPENLYRRARHVVTENARVLAARKALEERDLAAFGALMQESHLSLRDDFEVSCKELDVMVELANGFDGCFGARMTGGGFGGCTINLVRVAQVEEFAIHMREGYQGATGIAPEIYSCAAADGAGEVL